MDTSKTPEPKEKNTFASLFKNVEKKLIEKKIQLKKKKFEKDKLDNEITVLEEEVKVLDDAVQEAISSLEKLNKLA